MAEEVRNAQNNGFFIDHPGLCVGFYTNGAAQRTGGCSIAASADEQCCATATSDSRRVRPEEAADDERTAPEPSEVWSDMDEKN